MHRLFTKLFLTVLMIIFIAPHSASAMPEIFPFNELRSGLTGKAYTVVDGSGKIENFDVSIIGFTDDGKGSSRMIIARVSGEVVERTGGILQGMSGSPVYINGKLVGALSATLKEMDPYTVFIRPIESMLELWTLPDPKAQVNYFRIETEEETNSDEPAEVELENKNEPTDEPADKVTDDETEELGAFYLGGFNADGARFLQHELGLINLQSTPNSLERGINLNATLDPGSALGVALIYGDFSLGATGTVTAVDGKRILAFGHSFMHNGNVNYFMTDASVIGAVSGITGTGVKLAGIGNIIGRINQDRDSGIAGILGTFPAVVPVTVTVHDNALNKEETYNATIAYNENLIPKLGAAIAYAALSKMSDTAAESTVEVDFTVKTNAIASGEITRKNMFYNVTDVGQVAILELMQALNLVCSNTREESNIFGVDVNISFDVDRRTASIVSITPDKKSVKPGETINLIVEIQPYRKPVETVTVPYTVPLTAHPGSLSLEVHGGALVQVNQALTNAGLITADSNKSYEDRIKEFLSTGKNNQILVEVVNSNETRTEKQMRQDIAQAKRAQERLKKEGKPYRKVDSKVDTGYIIDNVMRTVLTVEKV